MTLATAAVALLAFYAGSLLMAAVEPVYTHQLTANDTHYRPDAAPDYLAVGYYL